MSDTPAPEPDIPAPQRPSGLPGLPEPGEPIGIPPEAPSEDPDQSQPEVTPIPSVPYRPQGDWRSEAASCLR
jgi:hypothetical protein